MINWTISAVNILDILWRSFGATQCFVSSFTSSRVSGVSSVAESESREATGVLGVDIDGLIGVCLGVQELSRAVVLSC